MKEFNKIQVVDKNSPKNRNEILVDYTGEFETIGKLSNGDQIRTTQIRFRKITDYEAYTNSIDDEYDAEDSNSNSYFFKIDTPQFNIVNGSQYGIGCDFKHEFIEHHVQNCFIPAKGYCFVKCIDFLTGGDYKQQYLDFIRIEERRSNIMTVALIQTCLRNLGVNHGYYNGKEIYPRTITNRNIVSFLYNNLFCLIWNSQNVSFIQAIIELKENFKIVDKYITEQNVNSHFNYEYITKK